MVSPEMQNQIVEIARETMGVKWEHMGRWKITGHIGIDCAGLLIWLVHRLGLEYVDHKGWYDPFPDGHTLIDLIRQNPVVEIDPADAGPGSIVVFHVPKMTGPNKRPMHCGIITGLEPRYMIHSLNKPGVMKVCETRVLDRVWATVTHAFDYDERAVR